MSDDANPCPAACDARQRLGDLEAEIAFQGDTVRELNEALAAQQLDLMALKRQVELLGEQLGSLRRQVGVPVDGAADERPPHY